MINPQSRANTGIADLRAQLLRDTGKTVGFRGGMVSRSMELLRALEGRAPALEAMFQFSPLVSRSGALPPVITTAQEVAAFAQDQIRTANQVYKIEREERFVSVPPTWRDYLLIGLPNKPWVELPDLQARPQDGKEQALWKASVEQGWGEGRAQADAILAANFNRLVRDFNGMVLYSTLLQQGMISPTRVAESQQTVTGDHKRMVLGDRLRRMTGKAGFETDARKWRPTLRSSPTSAAPAAARPIAPAAPTAPAAAPGAASGSR
ncbi:type IV secretory system conjugative DNA transfer family protein [Azohydromonas australica]|uniref:type IV secretory system conjugative DNA transfer family protein n=1 Tax=Azohydromonas australica TaxID=364039 RepID=UPI001EE3FD9C|nr:type IV secretory system conjugative DNA transfer family protein [Azohydromonas australica]